MELDQTTLKILQSVPPLLVVCLMVVACVVFYVAYVVKAKVLNKDLQWTQETLKTMKSGEQAPHALREGLTKVFAGTVLEPHWAELSRTLHPQYLVVEGEKKLLRHRLTVPVETYFSPMRVIDRPLRVHYFRHFPGILTGVGIIGTFYGLLIGISNFDTSNSETMFQSIGLLLLGVRDAFFVSALAITVAMVVTHLEKFFYQRCLTRLEELSDSVQKMFEAGVYEEYLSSISASTVTPQDQASIIAKEIANALDPMLENLSQAHENVGQVASSSIANALNAANVKLVAQIESALQRQVRTPIDSMNNKITKVLYGGAEGSVSSGPATVKDLLRAKQYGQEPQLQSSPSEPKASNQ